jgi:hypothetical protein
MLLVLVGLEFEPQPCIPLCVILIYRSLYGETRIAQTSGPHMPERRGPECHAVGGILEPNKISHHPFYIK